MNTTTSADELRHGVDPAACVAYGDHASDLPMLDAVGHAVVVGDDPVLIALAAARSWDVLPGRAAPEPPARVAEGNRAPL